jgi:hypothetical protein
MAGPKHSGSIESLKSRLKSKFHKVGVTAGTTTMSPGVQHHLSGAKKIKSTRVKSNRSK